jgi:HEAT repeat protein
MKKELTQLRTERELKELRSLVEELENHEDWQIQLQAITRLLKVKKTTEFFEEALPALINALSDPHHLVRQAAIPALGDIGPSAKSGIPALTEILKEGDLPEKKAAVYSLGKIGFESASASSEMISLLRMDDEEIEKAIGWALGIIGPDVLPDLIKGTKDEHSGVKRGCLQAIGNMGPVAVPAIEYLLTSLKDSDSTVRLEGAKAIGNLRAAPEIIQCVPFLKASLDDSDPDVRWTIAEALRKIGTEEAINAWGTYETIDTIEARMKQLGNDDKAVRFTAAEALYSILEKDSEIDFTVINKALNDTYPKVPVALCVALSKIEETALPALPTLLELTTGENDIAVRVAVITTIGKIGATDDDTVEKLIPLLDDQEKEVRMATGLALELLDTPLAQKALKKFKWA